MAIPTTAAAGPAARCRGTHRIVIEGGRRPNVPQAFKSDDLRLVHIYPASEAYIVHRIGTHVLLGAAFGVAALIGLVAQPFAALAADAVSVPSETANRVHVVDVRRDDVKDTLAVTLRIDPGFHINANPASSKYLIPTSLNVVGVQPVRVAYPPPVYFKPKFADERIAVYEGTVVITVFFAQGALRHLSLFGTTVTAQACTDAICFPPADLPVRPR